MTRRHFMLAALAPAAAGPAPVEVIRVPSYTEGPVFDYEGNLYFSHGRYVTRLAPGGVAERWLEVDGPNGHKVLPDGVHLVCEAKRGVVLRVSAAGRILGNASAECDGKPLRAPNDLTLDERSGFYFTDPGGSREASVGTIHYVDRAGITHLAVGGLRVPNGLALRPGGEVLLVAETVPNRILEFRVLAPGRLGPARVFAELPGRPGSGAEPDGMALDEDGNLYVAHLGMSAVQVLDTGGRLLRTLAAGNYDASNVVFGGPRRDQLYVTGSIGHRSNTEGRVYRIDLPGVRGVSALLPRG